jgi:hypothetical protein
VSALAISVVAGVWVLVPSFAHKSKSRIPVTQTRNLSPNMSERPLHDPAGIAVSTVAAQSKPAYTQNEFAADDAAVQRAANDYAAQGEEPAVREFVTAYRDLAERFAAESSTETGTRLRTEILTHLSEDAAAPMAIQLECRQTICRVQLTGPEQDKNKAMEGIRDVGAFRQVIGMQRPVDAGANISDVYLVMH